MCPDSDVPALRGIEPVLFPQSSARARHAPEARFVRNAWYVAMAACDLVKGKLAHRTIMNEPIAFYRKEDGGIAAITDRCPHRSVPLSMGTLLSGDRVQCIYHGLEFGPDGRCLKNPHGNNKIFTGLHLSSYPAVEKHALIWIWMGQKAADPATIPDYACLVDRPPSHVTRVGYLHVKAHYLLLVDNLLDLSHTSYTHAGVLGNADTATADPLIVQNGDVVTATRDSPDAETPGILLMMAPRGFFDRGDQWQSISWFPASNLRLEFGASKVGEPKARGTGYFALHFLTPETERTTHYHYTAARWNVLTGDERNKEIRDLIYKMRTFAFAEQDVPVIEAQQVSMDHASEELPPTLLSVDAGPSRYQKVLDRLLAEER